MTERLEKNDRSTPDQLPPLDDVNNDVFTWETSDIFDFIKSEQNSIAQGRNELSLAERSLPSARAVALARTREKFVNNADYAELANLADIIVSAPEAEIVQIDLSKINARLSELQIKDRRGGGLSQLEVQERTQLDAQRKLEVARILPFNHKLRELIDIFADVVPRRQIENLVEKAMNGSGGTARRIVAGMGAEVAVARVARAMFGEENVRLSTQPEDAKGMDIAIIVHGREVPIDVKTGGNIDDTRSNYKEVAVEQNQIEGFNVRADQERNIHRQLQDAIRS